MEEVVSRVIERGEVLYYSAYQTQYNLEHFKVERMGFEQLCSLSTDLLFGWEVKRTALEKAG
jgi:hypothetical protein